MLSKIHPLADVKSVNIGENTTIWQFAVVLEGAQIGKNCNINCHTFVENDVIIGNNVTIKSGVFLWDGITIGDHAFVGPNATFTNDLAPRSKCYPADFLKIELCEWCSIGANATILGGITIGKYALIGAGSLVTKSVPDYAMVYGSPAKIMGWLDDLGNKLEMIGGTWKDSDGNCYSVVNNDRVLIK